MKIAIDASRNRSGGAVAHLVGLIKAGDPEAFGIQEVHVWAYAKLLKLLPERPWLIRHSLAALERGIISQLLWQRFVFQNEIRQAGCELVFNTDAGSIGRFSPSVSMSQDMLSYEPGEMRRFGFGTVRLRLFLLRFMQNASMRHADGVIFLTSYAANVIQGACGPLANVRIIPHGLHEAFRAGSSNSSWPNQGERAIRCIYVSNAAPYKHQWHVVRAIAELRDRGFELELVLVGGGGGSAQARLDSEIARSDPNRLFVRQLAFLPNSELPQLLADSDLFIFASSCENMPVTLLEAMAVGLPVACSNRGPMPEVLQDAGVYFNPEDHESIAAAINRLLVDPTLRAHSAAASHARAAQFSWKRCAGETFEFLAATYRMSTQ